MEKAYQPTYNDCFFKQDGTPINIKNQYKNASCFFIGSGPSLSEVNLDLLKEPGTLIMSVNNGASALIEAGITPDLWTCVDFPDKFIKQIWLNPKITKFCPSHNHSIPLFDNEKWEDMNIVPRDCPNVYFYYKQTDFNKNNFFKEPCVCWGAKDFRSVFIASLKIMYHLGIRNVYLLGVDFDMSADKPYVFKQSRNDYMLEHNAKLYEGLNKYIVPEIVKIGKEKYDFNMYTCNKKTKLVGVDFVPFNEAIKRVNESIGPFDNITTDNMYSRELVKK